MARMGGQHQQAQPPTRSPRYRGISDVAMTCFINPVALARCFGRRVSRAALTGLHPRKPLETVGVRPALLVHRAEATVLMRPDLLPATVRAHCVQLWRNHSQIGVRS